MIDTMTLEEIQTELATADARIAVLFALEDAFKATQADLDELDALQARVDALLKAEWAIKGGR